MQNNLGIALTRLGEREDGTARLEEAVAAFCEVLTVRTPERRPFDWDWASTAGYQGVALMQLARRTRDAATAGMAVAQIEAALDIVRPNARSPFATYYPFAAYYSARLDEARTLAQQISGRSTRGGLDKCRGDTGSNTGAKF